MKQAATTTTSSMQRLPMSVNVSVFKLSTMIFPSHSMSRTFETILCPMKTSIRKFCNKGNDITSAAQMRYALKERPFRGMTESVNIVNTGANNLEAEEE